VEYIARGQIKTLACYDVFPSLSIGQIYKAADWYEKTRKFQRAVAKSEGKLEEVNGGRGERLGDGVDVPSKPANVSFPYVREPNNRTDLPPPAFLAG
jgi:hypothetical protein